MSSVDSDDILNLEKILNNIKDDKYTDYIDQLSYFHKNKLKPKKDTTFIEHDNGTLIIDKPKGQIKLSPPKNLNIDKYILGLEKQKDEVKENLNIIIYKILTNDFPETFKEEYTTNIEKLRELENNIKITREYEIQINKNFFQDELLTDINDSIIKKPSESKKILTVVSNDETKDKIDSIHNKMKKINDKKIDFIVKELPEVTKTVKRKIKKTTKNGGDISSKTLPSKQKGSSKIIKTSKSINLDVNKIKKDE